MCRNITLLFNFQPPATEDEIHACALQYVRKVSGMRAPGMGNKAAFDAAVRDVERATRELVASLVTQAPPRSRDVEKAKARERGKKRDERMRVKLVAQAP